MAVMGFSTDPGPLPFVTVRPRDKWGPRLAGMDAIDLQSDRPSFKMPPRARIAKIEDYTGAVPAHLAGLYAGQPLIAVHLEQMLETSRGSGG